METTTGVSIVMSEVGVTINEFPLRSNVTLADLKHILGPNFRRSGNSVEAFYWDDVGISAVSSGERRGGCELESALIAFITVTFFLEEEIDFKRGFPKNEFTGNLNIFGMVKGGAEDGFVYVRRVLESQSLNFRPDARSICMIDKLRDGDVDHRSRSLDHQNWISLYYKSVAASVSFHFASGSRPDDIDPAYWEKFLEIGNNSDGNPELNGKLSLSEVEVDFAQNSNSEVPCESFDCLSKGGLPWRLTRMSCGCTVSKFADRCEKHRHPNTWVKKRELFAAATILVGFVIWIASQGNLLPLAIGVIAFGVILRVLLLGLRSWYE